MDLGSIALDTRARLHRGRLDTLLATGARPEESAELARRAQQLGSIKMRRGLAGAPLIEEVASHMEGSEPISVRGVALVERLLTWGGSPLYSPHGDGALEADLRHARAALLLRSR